MCPTSRLLFEAVNANPSNDSPTNQTSTSDKREKVSIRELVVRILADITLILRAEIENLKNEAVSQVRTYVTRTVNEIVQKEILPPLKATALPSALIGLGVALIATAGLLFTFSGVYGWIESGMPIWLAFLVQGLILLLVALILIGVAVALLAKYAKKLEAKKAASKAVSNLNPNQ